MHPITPCLTFARDGKKAIEFYCSVFKNSEVHSTMLLPGSDQLLHAEFSLNGQKFMAMDGGDTFHFSEGISLFVNCADQAEVDYYWGALTAGGGEPGQCGWLKDQFSLSWQVIPARLGELMSGPDHEASGRVMQAMLQMRKIEVAGLEAAARGEG